MRFSIEHQGRYGLFRRNPRFTLYLSLEFSNEERAIADVRALHNYIFDLSPGYLATTESRHSSDALAGMMTGSLALFGIGVILIFVSAFAPAFGVFAIIGLIGGPALWWYSQLALRHEEQAYIKAVSLAYLLSNPAIAIQADNPAQAPLLEHNIRNRLLDLKVFLTTTHELVTPRTFEL